MTVKELPGRSGQAQEGSGGSKRIHESPGGSRTVQEGTGWSRVVQEVLGKRFEWKKVRVNWKLEPFSWSLLHKMYSHELNTRKPIPIIS